MLSVTRPGPETVRVPVKAALKLYRSPTPACRPLPCAAAVAQLPSSCGATAVKGRLLLLTPVALLHATVPSGGLKASAGKACTKAGVAVPGVVKAPEPEG